MILKLHWIYGHLQGVRGRPQGDQEDPMTHLDFRKCLGREIFWKPNYLKYKIKKRHRKSQ